MKLKVFYMYFKLFIWLFLMSNIIDVFCISRDTVTLVFIFLQDLAIIFFLLDNYNNIELPNDCKTWEDYYESLIELNKQPMTKEDKKIIEQFIPEN